MRELAALGAAVDTNAPLWLKDDSLTASPWGGNKPRKLEWILADANARRYRTIVTFGGLATNHGLATALYAREHGLRCVLALVDQPLDDRVEHQLAQIYASATAVHRTRTTRRTVLALPYLLARYAQVRPPRSPYWLPRGGSSSVGSLGFVEAGLELARQVESGGLPEPQTIVVALGSGGTAAGLLAGLRLAGLRTRVSAVLVNDQLKPSGRSVVRLARRTLRLLASRGAEVGHARIDPNDVTVLEGFLGSGYGHRTREAAEARRVAHNTEGLLLDPVYTGKAVAALLAGAEKQAFGDGPVLYWHTHSGVGEHS